MKRIQGWRGTARHGIQGQGGLKAKGVAIGGELGPQVEVGQIVEIRNDESGMFAAAIARPAAALDRSGDVLLLQDLPQPMGPPVPDATQAAAAPASDGPSSDAEPKQ